MNSFGETFANIGLLDTKIKDLVNMDSKIKHSLIGKSIKVLLKDGKKDRLECQLLTH